LGGDFAIGVRTYGSRKFQLRPPGRGAKSDGQRARPKDQSLELPSQIGVWKKEVVRRGNKSPAQKKKKKIKKKKKKLPITGTVFVANSRLLVGKVTTL